MNTNQRAEVAQLARDMAAGYASHITAWRMPPKIDRNAFVKFIGENLIDSVPRKNGPPWTFGVQDTFYEAVVRDRIREEFPIIWLTGALLAVGDALKASNYFDHAPDLELVYHLRNGIAHVNRFTFTQTGRKRLKRAAHNRDGAFKITTELEGQTVLFDYMQAGDVLGLLPSVASHLDQIVRDASPQPVVVT